MLFYPPMIDACFFTIVVLRDDKRTTIQSVLVSGRAALNIEDWPVFMIQ